MLPMTDGHFEAKKHGYRQTQDGIVISFLIHPNDISSAIAVSPLGTRFMVAFSEIGDDGKPVPDREQINQDAVAKLLDTQPEPAKPRRAFKDLPYSQQAGIRCGDAEFVDYIARRIDGDKTGVAEYIRRYCCVTSRAELDDETNAEARERWECLNAEFEAWQTDKRYKDSAR